MKNRDFVITSLQSWDIPIGSNAIDIAREISKDNRVLYVNSPRDMMGWFRNPAMLRRDKGNKTERIPGEMIRRITANLTVIDLPFLAWPVNGLPDGRVFDFFNKLNNQSIFRYLKGMVQKMNMKNIVHLIDNDIYRSFHAKEILRPRISVYYRRDNLQPMAYWQRHAPRLEPVLIAKSDLVICNATRLRDYALQYNKNSFDVGQGVDLNAYDPRQDMPLPSALASIPPPRIGYIGDINSHRLDADLICHLASERPEYSFVIIGTEDETFSSHRLHELPNIHFPGSIPKDRVPAYIKGMHVCINPQLINDITIGNYPRKVDEYLAMGKPVVATMTDAMGMFHEHAYLCTTREDHLHAIDRALLEADEKKAEDRILFARTHGWTNCVQRIYDRISTHSPQ